MNRVILLLNVVVLVVSFALALTATDSQIGILQSASAAAYGGQASRVYRRDTGATPEVALAHLRLALSLESVLPKAALEALTARQLRALHSATVGYRRRVADGVATMLAADLEPRALRDGYARLGRDAREFVEDTLAASFPDPGILRRLTTEVIKSCG